MKAEKHEQGQALVLIVVGIIGLISLVALTVDGGLAYSDRRHAQNAADSAALAAALARGRGRNISNAAQAVATTNGYDNDNATNIVTVTITDSPSGVCPSNAAGKDINVQITSHVNTFFAPIIGVNEVTNTVSATSRSCGTYMAPVFGGQALVSLSPSGIDFNANGTPKWTITGSGIYSNSSSCSSVTAGGSGQVTVPSITMVASSCGTSGISGTTVNTDATPYTWEAYKSTLPPSPNCSATATYSGGQWHPAAGTTGTNIGSNVALSGNMDFASGLYCITNNPGSFNGAITGSGVTFYSNKPGFNWKFAGSGAGFGSGTTGQEVTAPTAGDYKGVLLYVEPEVSGNNLLETQELDLRGNGNTGMVGSIIAPSADITLFGNSTGTAVYQTQLVGYTIDSGGNADIKINYNSSVQYQSAQPVTLSLIQ